MAPEKVCVCAGEEEVEFNTGPCSFFPLPSLTPASPRPLPALALVTRIQGRPPEDAGGPGRQDRLFLGSGGPSEPNFSGKREDTGLAYGKLGNGGTGILDKVAGCRGASGPLF